ncbi:MAG: hypothetical protein ABIQ59_18175 [Nocardioidaceae bacterium]
MNRSDPDVATGARLWPVLVAVAVLAAVVRTVILLDSGGLSGLLGYDQGVYYSAAEAFAWGRMPYRDFLLLHPPGIVVALAPFGLLARLTHDAVGMEAARVFVVAVGAANAALVAAASRRAGRVAALTAGAFYAVWAPVAVTETETRLEPLLTLGLLVALAVLAGQPERVGRRALVLAGCALGFALTVKIWALVPVVVVLAWLVGRFGRRALAWVGLPLLATTAAVCLPFLVSAPVTMFRMVVTDQLSRGRMASTAAHRVAGTLGLGRFVGHPPGFHGLLLVAVLVLAAALVLVVVLVPPARVAVVLLLAQGGVLLAGPSYFAYYEAYPAPALALCFGAFVGLVVALVRHRVPAPVRVRRTASALVAVAVVVALGAIARTDSVTVVGRAFPAAVLRASVAHARCVTSDSVDALVQLDVFGRNVRRGCPVVVDLGGLAHDRDAATLADGRVETRRENSRWQQDADSYFASGAAEVVVRSSYDGFDPALRRRLRRDGLLADAGAFRVYGNPRTPRP